MRRITMAAGLAVLMTIGANAQRGHGGGMGMRGAPMSVPMSRPMSMPGRSTHSAAGVHSNARWSSDRDKGRLRASDVGKGHKKGLSRTHRNKGKRRRAG